LIQGQVSERQFECLLRYTKFKSERKIDALRAHLVDGHNKSLAYTVNDLKGSKFDDALAVMNDKWSIHQDLIDATNEFTKDWGSPIV
jgi:hypothetical protein